MVYKLKAILVAQGHYARKLDGQTGLADFTDTVWSHSALLNLLGMVAA